MKWGACLYVPSCHRCQNGLVKPRGQTCGWPNCTDVLLTKLFARGNIANNVKRLPKSQIRGPLRNRIRLSSPIGLDSLPSLVTCPYKEGEFIRFKTETSIRAARRTIQSEMFLHDGGPEGDSASSNTNPKAMIAKSNNMMPS